jgi:hypothetical protein
MGKKTIRHYNDLSLYMANFNLKKWQVMPEAFRKIAFSCLLYRVKQNLYILYRILDSSGIK